MVGQAGRNAGQSVVVEVQLSQVGDISQCAIFHRADLIVAQTQPEGKKQKNQRVRWDMEMCKLAEEQGKQAQKPR